MKHRTVQVTLHSRTRESPTRQGPDVLASMKASMIPLENSKPGPQEVELRTSAGEVISAYPDQRVRMAKLAVERGADPERIARGLRWQDFEIFVNEVLRRDRFVTATHFVFRALGRRFEIDIVGVRESLVVCIDCKHWHCDSTPSRIKGAVREQARRVSALSHMPEVCAKRLKIGERRSIRLLPVVVTLADTCCGVVEGVPVVSALRLRTFVSEISPYAANLDYVDACFPKPLERI